MKALAGAQNPTPNRSSRARAGDRRPRPPAFPRHPGGGGLHVSCIFSFASEWLSFPGPQILCSGLQEDLRGIGEQLKDRRIPLRTKGFSAITACPRLRVPSSHMEGVRGTVQGACNITGPGLLEEVPHSPPGLPSRAPPLGAAPGSLPPPRTTPRALRMCQVMSPVWFESRDSWFPTQHLRMKSAKCK